MRRRKTAYTLVTLVIIIITSVLISSTVIAPSGPGVVRIEPHSSGYPDPVMQQSPASFNLSTQSKTLINGKLLFVITEDCWGGLGSIRVHWDDLYIPDCVLYQGDFTFDDCASNSWIPKIEELYQAASLRDHLGKDESEGIYWGTCPVPFSSITKTDYINFTVTVDSEDIRVLVYAYGDSGLRVPNSRPGFVIPEIPMGTILGLATMVAAATLFNRQKYSLE